MTNVRLADLIKESDLSPDIQLQPHQQRVKAKVRQQIAETGKARLLLYHGLGSGKGGSSLAALDEIGGEATAVVPAALRENYRKEIAKFQPTNTQINVISQDALGAGAPLAENVVTDEVHRLRNPNSARGRALLDQAPNLKSLLLLSGSPIVNQPSDLSPIVSALTGQTITPEQFNERFVRFEDEKPSFLGRLFGSRTKPLGVRNEEELADLLRGKVDYHAPPTAPARQDTEDIHVEMSSDQDELYRGMYERLPYFVRKRLESDYPLSPAELSKYTAFLTGPRQVSLSTNTFARGRNDPYRAFRHSPKLQEAFKRMKAQLDQDPQARGLVFANFIDAGLTPYAAALERAGIPHGVFSGSLSDIERKQLVSEINEGKKRVALIGPAGTEGLSFKGTRLIQLLDPHWNDARRRQSIGRGIRHDSHSHLPEDQRNVKVERYFSDPRKVTPLGKFLWNYQNRPGADRILVNASDRKELLNTAFNEFLQRVGSEAA
jgi:hypothetical protein